MKHLMCHGRPQGPRAAARSEKGIPCAVLRTADRWRAALTEAAGVRWARLLADALRGLSAVSQEFFLKRLVLKIFLLRKTVRPERNYLSLSFLLLVMHHRKRKPYTTIPWTQPVGKYMGTIVKHYLCAAYGVLHTSPVFTVHPRAVLQLL